MAVDTYYFDASDAGPTDVSTQYTDDANAFDGSTVTFAFNTGEDYFLNGTGTDAPTSGDAISQVRARAYLGSSLDAGDWSSYVVLSEPSGGWDWTKVNDLEVRFSGTDSGATTDTLAQIYYSGVLLGTALRVLTSSIGRFYRAEVEVTSGPIIDPTIRANINGGSNIRPAAFSPGLAR